jgi:thiamine transport system substrate-binding protein
MGTMPRRIFSFFGLVAMALATLGASAQELRVLVHSSFSLPKPMLAAFEADAGVKLSLIKGGDAGEMLNKLILTRAQPIADVVFGIDNVLVVKAQAANVLDAYSGPATQRPPAVALAAGVLAVDYGYVTLNYDRAWFARSGLALPRSLEDLTQPAYRNLVAVQNPATSSPGLAFLLSTITGLGEEPAFDWWARMRANGLKVTKGWSEAYYTEFTRNGGTRPLVVSYASSPAAEVFYSKEKITEPPTGSLTLKGAVFRQVEGVALVRGGQQREAAQRFLEFMRSAPVQEALQTSMWMYAAEPHTQRPDVMRHAVEPSGHDSPANEAIAARGADWVDRWTRVVLK